MADGPRSPATSNRSRASTSPDVTSLGGKSYFGGNSCRCHLGRSRVAGEGFFFFSLIIFITHLWRGVCECALSR